MLLTLLYLEANALDERSKAWIRAQAIEGRFDLEHGHLPIPRFERFGQPWRSSTGAMRKIC
jgi:hypothetical protein